MTAGKCANSVEHISREAGDKTKGFRFQKLRAAIRFLQRVRENCDGQVHCAMELLEDSVLYDGNSESLISGEENKYYGSRISFNSPALKNTLVAFLDLYFAFARSSELKLGVYASAEISQERITADFRKRLGLEPTQKHYDILKRLTLGEKLDDEEKSVAFAIVKAEYFEQYPDTSKGYRALLEAMTQEEFSVFIKSIDWTLTNESNESLEATALDLVRTCRLFNHRHLGLEQFILSALLDALEKRSGARAITDRLLSTDSLKNIFNEILLGPTEDERTDDPAWDEWAEVENSDFRNLSEKIKAVCPDFSTRILKALARSCSLARSVEAEGQREMKALLRRILDACELHILTNHSASSVLTQKQVLDMVEELGKVAEHHVATLRGRYRYALRDAHSIKGAVLTLFDDCYLAFDEVKVEQ
ncbi:hypothetical protein [Burkholderia glumae]|uniref:hypothetical protein n=1 Tax=Burkholderia glumae TaxID=337 RepID=UPI00214A1600|nr:hypothetical protein [Burkholderia glumae]MCR1769125.1 hypothetical protein [Burkholderia glumae]